MSDNPRNAFVKFGYEVDTSSEARIKASTELFIQHMRFMARAAEQTGTTAQGVARGIAAAFEAQKNTVQATVRSEAASLQQLRDEFDKTGAAAKSGLRVEGIRRTGGALSQLGLGDVGGGISRVGDIAQLGKEAGELVTALGPLAPVMAAGAGAAVGLEIGLKIVDAQLKEVGANLTKASDQLKIYYDLIINGTTATIRAQVEAARIQKQFAEDELKVRKDALEAVKPQAGESGLQQFVKVIAQTRPEFQKLQADMEAAQQKVDAFNNTIEVGERALGSTNVAINTFIDTLDNKLKQAFKDAQVAAERYWAAQAKLGAELRKAGDAEINRIKDEQRVNKELLSFSYDQAQQRIKQIEDEKAVNDKIILTRGLANSQLDKNSDAYKQNVADMKAATEANENLNRELGVLAGAMDSLPAEIEAANKRIAATTQKYNDDRTAIEQRSLEQRAAIQERYNDKLIEIARNTADAAEKALIDAQRAAEDTAISRAREENRAAQDAIDKRSDIILNAQREESKALRAHQRELEQIRSDARAREIGFLLRRDFESLFLSRLQTTTDINKSNTQFGDQESQRREGEQQQFRDLARSLERERRARQQAAAEQLQDANRARARAMQDEQRNRERELRLAAETRDKDLRNLSQKTTQELNLKRQAYDAELRMVSMYGKARVDAETRIQNELLRQAQRIQGMVSGASGGTTFMTQSTSNVSRNVTQNFNGAGLDQILQQVVNIVRGVDR